MTKHLHEERRISFAELGALLGTRELLKRGLLEFSECTNAALIGPRHLFNMSRAIDTNYACGTVGCIGGTMGLLMNKSRSEITHFVDTNGPLHLLFYPDRALYSSYRNLQPKQAIAAIDLWLAGDDNPWRTLRLKARAKEQAKVEAKAAKAKAKGRKSRGRR